MSYWLDLHMHSSFSNDGEITPSELMQKCAQANLKTVALSDHNSIEGIEEARLAAQSLNLQFIPAIELDCQFNGKNLHILGYGINDKDPIFKEIQKKVSQDYLNVSKQRIENIRQLGFIVNDDKLYSLTKTGIIMSSMLAEAILTDPANDDNPLLIPYRPGQNRSDNPFVNFAWDFCVQGKKAYAPIKFMPINEAIETIHQTGGCAVWAHPGANIGCDAVLADAICQCGIDGVEVYSNYHKEDARRFYLEKTAKFNLIPTIGSDFHGKAKPAIHLGEIYADNEEEMLEALLEARKKSH